MRFSASC